MSWGGGGGKKQTVAKNNFTNKVRRKVSKCKRVRGVSGEVGHWGIKKEHLKRVV